MRRRHGHTRGRLRLGLRCDLRLAVELAGGCCVVERVEGFAVGGRGCAIAIGVSAVVAVCLASCAGTPVASGSTGAVSLGRSVVVGRRFLGAEVVGSGASFLAFLRSSSTTPLKRAKRRIDSAAWASLSSTRWERRALAWAVARRIRV
jgi:hypothetical protein